MKWSQLLAVILCLNGIGQNIFAQDLGTPEVWNGLNEDITFSEFYRRNRSNPLILKNFREPKYIGSRSLVDSSGEYRIKLEIHDMGSDMTRIELGDQEPESK